MLFFHLEITEIIIVFFLLRSVVIQIIPCMHTVIMLVYSAYILDILLQIPKWKQLTAISQISRISKAFGNKMYKNLHSKTV